MQEVGKGTSWLVPAGVNVDPTTRAGDTSYESFKSGETAAKALSVDTHLATTYMAVSGNVGFGYSNVWADNSNSEVNQAFDADVGAEFNGLTAQGKVDVKVNGSEQFTKFEHSLQKLSSCLGGDPKLSASLAANPGDDLVFETFIK
ncbi:MAG: hypothetical protein Q9210_003654 [Variospora velana]